MTDFYTDRSFGDPQKHITNFFVYRFTQSVIVHHVFYGTHGVYKCIHYSYMCNSESKLVRIFGQAIFKCLLVENDISYMP